MQRSAPARGRIGLLVPLLVGLFACPLPALSQGPPRHAGKTLEEWVQQLRQESIDEGGDACAAVVRIGAPAVPALVAELRKGPPRGQGAPILWAVPFALRGIGAPAVPGLAALLADRSASPYARQEAAGSLGIIGRHVAAAIAPLVAVLNDRSEADRLRHAAVSSLGDAGMLAREAVPALAAAAGNSLESVWVRPAAAAALARIGPCTVESVETLVSVLGRDEPVAFLAEAAAAALAAIDPDCTAAVPVLLQALNRKQRPALREAACLALGRLGAAAMPAGPALAEALGSKRPEVRAAVLTALAAVAPEAQATLRAQTDALLDSEGVVRVAAASGLGHIPAHRPTAVAALVREVASRARGVAGRAARALGEIGPGAAPAVPALRATLRDQESTDLAPWAAFALQRIDPADPEPLAELLRPLRDPCGDETLAATEVIGLIGAPAALSAVPLLRRNLYSSNSALAAASAKSLSNLLGEPVAAPAMRLKRGEHSR